MIRRKRSPWRFIIPALLVGASLWWARVWPFQRSATPPAASMPTGGDVAERGYGALSASFRSAVPLEEFASMLQRMADPDRDGEMPQIRLAQIVDAAPADPTARFRVEYPSDRAKAEYHFARVDGAWRLQSFTRTPSAWPPIGAAVTPRNDDQATPPVKGGEVSPPPPPPPAPKDDGAEGAAPPKPGTATPPKPTPPAPKAAGAPCDYVIQQGDTLSAISRHFYGTTRYWRRILEANPGLNERRLRIGRRIRIPSAPEPVPPAADAPAAPQSPHS